MSEIVGLGLLLGRQPELVQQPGHPAVRRPALHPVEFACSAGFSCTVSRLTRRSAG